ncbi:hypothetical protein EDC04DRAFT_2600237 [Pisolithus marmoratus]|nr:hypothetical protein EDC04DRAFT_2600237 [Pisolithus marmoratus]
MLTAPIHCPPCPHIEVTSGQKMHPLNGPASIVTICICPKGSKSMRAVYEGSLDQEGVRKHNKAYIQDICQTQITKEAAAAAAASLHVPEFLVLLLLWLSAGPSQPVPGSPTPFTLDEDDTLTGMMSPYGGDIPDSASAVGHSVNFTTPDVSHGHPSDFKTKFHPCSNCPTLYESFKDFDPDLWCPFTSEGDYIFASITVEAGLNSTQVDSLLGLVHHMGQGMANITLCNNAGLHATLGRAALQLTPVNCTQFLKFKITVPYKGNDMAFLVHLHPLWGWALNLLQNPSLALHFIWDAQWLFKHDGYCLMVLSRATLWWCIVQTCQFISIMVNDMWWVHYNQGVYQVPEVAKEERKTGYANLKCAVWHEDFSKLLEKVAELSKFTKDCMYQYACKLIVFHKEVLAIYDVKKSAGEKKLKFLGLCPVKNAFWSVENSEPKQAASFEPCHYLHGGLGGKHMHEELKIVVNELGCDFEAWLEEQNKMQDLTKLPQTRYSYLGLMYIHTEETIRMIEDELLVFRDKLKVQHTNTAFVIQKALTLSIIGIFQRDTSGSTLPMTFEAHIDTENEHANYTADDNDDHEKDGDDSEVSEENVKLGTPQQPTSLSDVETIHKDDRAFEGFCGKLETFLNTCLPTCGYPLDKWI